MLFVILILIVASILTAVFLIEEREQSSTPDRAHDEQLCTQCGTVGKPRNMGFAHGAILVLLLGCGILPGLVYIFLLSQRFPQCRICEAHQSVIPLDTPEARRILDRH